MTNGLRQSELFTKTRKEAPSDEVSKNATLLIRAGFIHKEMAGVYALLPLGMRVVEKIKNIVREEMSKIGGQEIIMTSLQRKDLWEKTGRWDDETVDIWFKSELKSGGEVGFGWSHEEPIADMMKSYIFSFRDLPIFVHQFQTKLRNELRAKSGIMRGREFIMNDMYSFCLNKEDHDVFYSKATIAYKKVFERLGVGLDTFVTFAAGGAFTKYSHEFQTICDAGEDIIYINREKKIAINSEVLNEETLLNLGIKREELEEVKTAEVGNIFDFGTEKCETLGVQYKNENGESVPVWLGSYGIGITRMVGVLVEKFNDDKGIIWPESVAPFKVHLLSLGEDPEVIKKASEVYENLKNAGVEVLFDDRVGLTAGEKFADADLLGMPYRAVVSLRSMKEVGGIELKKRTEEKGNIITIDKLLKICQKN